MSLWSLSTMSTRSDRSYDPKLIRKHVATCPRCSGCGAVSIISDTSRCPHTMTLRCDGCAGGVVWYSCLTCAPGAKNDKYKYLAQKDLSRHLLLYHKAEAQQKEKKTTTAAGLSLPVVAAANTCWKRTIPTDDHNQAMPNKRSKDIPSLFKKTVPNTFQKITEDLFPGEQSLSFFRDMENGESGISNIVVNSMPPDYSRTGRITDVISKHHLSLTNFGWSLSRSQRSKLCALLKSQETIVLSQLTGHCSAPLYVPSTEADFRRVYVGDGANSIATKLPHPLIHRLDNHAYVSLHEIIAHALAFGLFQDQLIYSRDSRFDAPFDSNMPVSNMTESLAFYNAVQKARVLYPNANVAVLWLAEWSDDFDPNSVKGNRESCWLKTVTVNPLNNADGGHQQFTFPVAVGSKSANHEEVEELFSGELQRYNCNTHELFGQNLYYDGHGKSLVQVYAEVVVSLQDQPERRSSTHLAAGNSKMHGRFGYSCNYAEIASRLVPCGRCSALIIADLNCRTCTNWETETVEDGNQFLAFKPPDNYPDTMDAGQPDHPQTVTPSRLSFGVLLDAFETAYENTANMSWSHVNSQAYLKRFCVRESTISSLLQSAAERRRLAVAEHALSDDPANRQALQTLEDYLDDPSLLVKPRPPASWRRGVELQCFADTPMHLLFLGITKTVVSDINEWATHISGYSALQRYGNDLLDDIPKLSWCKTLSYSGKKLGGWVSENYLAFARLAAWFYSPLEHIVKEDKYVEPNVSIDKWNVTQLRQWLKAHGVDSKKMVADIGNGRLRRLDPQSASAITTLSKEKGVINSSLKVKQLRDVVGRYKEMAGGPPARVSAKAASVETVNALVVALTAMIYHLMQGVQTQQTIIQSSVLVKNFLSVYAEFEKSQRTVKSSNTPQWISHYNFLSLLNLEDTQLRYGPLRNLWEGSSLGEGYIQVLKSEMGSGLGGGTWSAALLQRVMKKKTLQITEKGVSLQCVAERQVSTRSEICNELLYRDLVSLCSAFEARRPLKGVRVGDRHFLVARGGACRAVMTSSYSDQAACFYRSCKLQAYPATVSCNILAEMPGPFSPFIMLPLVNGDGIDYTTAEHVYTFIYDDWAVVGDDGIKTLP